MLKDTSTSPATLPDLAANKAFIAIEDEPAGSRGFIGLDDGTTGMRPTPAPSLNGGEWYDLSGRRLSGQPTKKGVYVRDGRKVVIK